jgi:hypothetical protein
MDKQTEQSFTESLSLSSPASCSTVASSSSMSIVTSNVSVSLSPGLSSEDFFLPFIGSVKQKHPIKNVCSLVKFYDSYQIWETTDVFNEKDGK